MQNSKIVEHHGIFLGAALCLKDDLGWRFVAADDRAMAVNGHVAATFTDVQSMVRNAFLSAGAVAAPALVPALHQAPSAPMLEGAAA